MKLLLRFLFIVITILVSTACGQQLNSEIQPSMGTPIMPVYPDCSQAELVSETIPAGTTFHAGEKFDKTWVIRNTSPCIWNSGYSLVYYEGIGMGEDTHLPFTANMPAGGDIPPDNTITLTLNLRAPFAAGRQVGYWKLRDTAGMLFMPENVSQDALSVDIEIIGTVYSFVDNYCQADWKLNGQDIDCPAYDEAGNYALQVNSFPEFEGGNIENESAINILLPGDEGSSISATFPPLVIKKGDHLHLTTACANYTPQCDLTFEVTALTEAGNYILGEWYEVSDGNMQAIDLDISQLAEISVHFVFTLRSNGAIQGNRGLWFFPVLLPY
jgi:hypothetical protein